MTLPLLLLGLAMLFLLAGSILMLVAAFRVSLAWGLVSLLVPFGILAFAFVHWSVARRGFFLQLVSVPFCVGAGALLMRLDNKEIEAFVSDQLSRNSSVPELSGMPEASPTPASTPVPALPPELFEAKVDANRRRFVELEKSYTQLTARRTMLQVGDPAAVRSFNDEVALYRDNLKAAQLEKKSLEAQRPPQLAPATSAPGA